MAVASSYSDPSNTRRLDDAEAARISNRIDEELRVCCQPFRLIAPISRPSVLTLPSQAEKELMRRRKNQKKDVKGESNSNVIVI